MKLIILILLFSVNINAKIQYYIVKDNGQNNIVGRAYRPPNVLFMAPKGERVMSDIKLQKLNITPCLDQPDCESKLGDICLKSIDEFGGKQYYQNSRGFIELGYDEAYCVQPRLDVAKKAARLAAMAAQDVVDRAKVMADIQRLNSIKGQCASASGLLKQLCEHITGL